MHGLLRGPPLEIAGRGVTLQHPLVLAPPMMPYSRLLLVLGLLVSLAATAADIYRWIDADGNVVFSDTPVEGAEKIEIGPLPTVPAVRPRPAPPPAAAPASADFTGYTSVAIVAPAHEETLRNVREAAVRVAVQPVLQSEAGHTVQLFVDGAPYGAPTAATEFLVQDLTRGQHQLSAAVLDADGRELLRSAPSVVYVHQHSIQHPRPKAAGKP